MPETTELPTFIDNVKFIRDDILEQPLAEPNRLYTLEEVQCLVDATIESTLRCIDGERFALMEIRHGEKIVIEELVDLCDQYLEAINN
jgi:hypothetical protein